MYRVRLFTGWLASHYTNYEILLPVCLTWFVIPIRAVIMRMMSHAVAALSAGTIFAYLSK